MFDFHEKRKIRRIIFSRPVIGLIFFAGILLSFSVYDRFVVSREMHAKLEKKYAELHALEARAALLQKKVDYLEDERGVEEELRNRFDVAKEGEQVVILLSNREEEASTTLEIAATEEKGLWGTVMSWFKD